MKRIIITALLLTTLIGCEKQTPPTQTTTTTTTGGSKEFTFTGYNLGMHRVHLYDGSTLLSSGFNGKNSCNSTLYDLEEGKQYRILVNLSGVDNSYTIVACEYTVTYENGDLTTVKSNGNYNMFYDTDCGYPAWTIK